MKTRLPTAVALFPQRAPANPSLFVVGGMMKKIMGQVGAATSTSRHFCVAGGTCLSSSSRNARSSGTEAK